MNKRDENIYMSPWHYDLLAQMTAPKDIPFYIGEVERYGGPVLDLACGTGRVSIPLAQKGYRVTGLDNSGPMIERAAGQAALAGVEIEFIQADLRDFDLGRKFNTVILAYNSLNLFTDHDSIIATLWAVKKHLDKSGRFIIDTFNPSLEFLAKDTSQHLRVIEYIDPDTKKHVLMTETSEYDNATQINHVTWHYQIDGEPDAMVHKTDMRVFFPRELDGLLKLTGFEIEHKFGDYEGNAFRSNSPNQIMVCERGADGGM